MAGSHLDWNVQISAGEFIPRRAGRYGCLEFMDTPTWAMMSPLSELATSLAHGVGVGKTNGVGLGVSAAICRK